MDFLANQLGAVWAWLFTWVSIPWLSFALVVVVIWLPWDLWNFFVARKYHRVNRFLGRANEEKERLESAAGDHEGFAYWKSQQVLKIWHVYMPGTGGLSGCLARLVKVGGHFVLGGAIFLGAWAVLDDPQRGIEPGASLWAALCGATPEGQLCVPGPVAVEGFDFRVPFTQETNTVGWCFLAFYFVWPLLARKPFAGSLKHNLMAWGFRFAFAAVFFFFPVGIMALQVVRSVQVRIVMVLGRGYRKYRRPSWDRVIDAELEAMALPDSFFVPLELEDPESTRIREDIRLSAAARTGRPYYPKAQARKAIMKLMAGAKRALKEQSLEGDTPLPERISLLESSRRLGDVRMIITHRPEGNVAVFIGEDAATVETLNEVKLEIEAGLEALPITIADSLVSDVLLDGSKVPEDEDPDGSSPGQV